MRSGLPGVAYVRTDDAAQWPSRLSPSAPPSAPAGNDGSRRRRRACRRRNPALRQAGRSRRRQPRYSSRTPGRAHRARRRRQIVAPRHHCRRPANPVWKSHVLGGDISDRGHRADVCPRIAYMPQGLGKNLYPDLSIRENIEFFARLFGQSGAERADRIADLLGQHRACALCRPSGQEALWRNEAEARTLLLPHP